MTTSGRTNDNKGQQVKRMTTKGTISDNKSEGMRGSKRE